jgi:hypothetical protein
MAGQSTWDRPVRPRNGLDAARARRDQSTLTRRGTSLGIRTAPPKRVVRGSAEKSLTIRDLMPPRRAAWATASVRPTASSLSKVR